jgi:peptidoglycan/LPS O-acetylase OafA/YrhL
MGALRLFLAWVVVSSHSHQVVLAAAGFPLPRALVGLHGGFAVVFFYMISGFLISYALSGKYGPTPTGTRDFYASRLIRIFGLYWPVVLLALLTRERAWTAFRSFSALDQATGIFLFGMDWRFALGSYPHLHLAAAVPGLAQAWTLGAELTCYLLAPFLLRSWTATWIVLGFSIATRAGLVAAFGTQTSLTYSFFPSTVMFFLLGHLAHVGSRRWPSVLHPAAVAGLLAGWIGFLFVNPDGLFDTWRFWASGLCFAAALPGIFHATKDVRALNVLGDLSYPVYLVHTLVLIGIRAAGPDLLNAFGEHARGAIVASARAAPTEYGVLALGAILVVVTLAAAMVHILVERPVTRMLHATFARGFARTRGGGAYELDRQVENLSPNVDRPVPGSPVSPAR